MSSVENYYQKSPDLIIAQNGELVHNGFGIFAYFGEWTDEVPSEIWLREESNQILKELNLYGRVCIKGGTGEGKGTLIYGARTLLRINQTPYFYIDGHFQDTDGKVIAEHLDYALEYGMTVFYDSSDYLTAGNRRIRQISQENQAHRSKQMFSYLQEYIGNGGKLVLTSHNDDWFSNLADPALLSEWNKLIYQFYEHKVVGKFSSSDELLSFWRDTGLMDEGAAEYLSNLLNRPDFIEFLINDKFSDKRYLEIFFGALNSYQIAKIIAKDNLMHNQLLLHTLNKVAYSFPLEIAGEQYEVPEEVLWEQIIDFVFDKYYTVAFYSATMKGKPRKDRVFSDEELDQQLWLKMNEF